MGTSCRRGGKLRGGGCEGRREDEMEEGGGSVGVRDCFFVFPSLTICPFEMQQVICLH